MMGDEAITTFMKTAPIGLGAYSLIKLVFLGPQLFGACIRNHWVFIMEFVLFFFVGYFLLHAFIAGTNGLKVFLR
jgi:hypothetical protein